MFNSCTITAAKSPQDRILFVKACSQLCTRTIKETVVVSADLFLVQFCHTSEFLTLYTKEDVLQGAVICM